MNSAVCAEQAFRGFTGPHNSKYLNLSTVIQTGMHSSAVTIPAASGKRECALPHVKCSCTESSPESNDLLGDTLRSLLIDVRTRTARLVPFVEPVVQTCRTRIHD